MFTLTPAYGRDYKSKAEVEADLAADKDFVANSHDGSSGYINRTQLLEMKVASVNVRYGKLRKVCIVKVKP
jgi:hypothetical protein